MDELAERFERERPRLRAVTYRMLGSTAEADDAGQIDNLAGWLKVFVRTYEP